MPRGYRGGAAFLQNGSSVPTGIGIGIGIGIGRTPRIRPPVAGV
jgi:hypothetical protein